MSCPTERPSRRRFSRASACWPGSRQSSAAASCGLASFGKLAVEVGARPDVEAALVVAEQMLGAADRVGPGDDGDGAADAALGLRLAQHRHQRVDRYHARQLAGVQRCLQIGGRGGVARALEAEDGEFVADADRVAGDPFHGAVHVKCPCDRRAQYGGRRPRPQQSGSWSKSIHHIDVVGDDAMSCIDRLVLQEVP